MKKTKNEKSPNKRVRRRSRNAILRAHVSVCIACQEGEACSLAPAKRVSS